MFTHDNTSLSGTKPFATLLFAVLVAGPVLAQPVPPPSYSDNDLSTGWAHFGSPVLAADPTGAVGVVLDGVDDRLVGSTPILQPGPSTSHSIAAWFKVPPLVSVGTSTALLGQQASGANGWHCLLAVDSAGHAGRVRAVFGANGLDYIQSRSLDRYDDDEWHQAVARLTNGTQLSLFVDGIEVGSYQLSSNIAGSGFVGTPTNFGEIVVGGGSGQYGLGFVSRVAAWEGIALTDAQILSLYLNSTPPNVTYADYGDAPDGTPARYAAPYDTVLGRFPTRFATSYTRYALPGAHILHENDSWLGSSVSFEFGALDYSDVDGLQNLSDDDAGDDGLTGGLCGAPPVNTGTGSQAMTLNIDVTVHSGAPQQARYLNILIDTDRSGEWSDEWYVQDFPVNVTPGTTNTIVTPHFNLPLPIEECWLRLALTTTPVASQFTDDGSGWDGSGVFDGGEIEDYFVGGLVIAHANVVRATRAKNVTESHQAKIEAVAATVADTIADIQFAWANVNTGAVATAVAAAGASAGAIAADEVYIQAQQAAAVALCVEATAFVGQAMAACVSCPCATLCVEVSTTAGANATACAALENSLAASVSAAALTQAFAAAEVAAATGAQVAVHQEMAAYGIALAAAEAHAFAISGALAVAIGQSSAASMAAANAQAAACSGDVGGAASARAAAEAAAAATAATYAAVEVEIAALADVETQLRHAIESAAAAVTRALSAEASLAHAAAQIGFFRSVAQQTFAAAQSQRSLMSSAFAATTAACSGDCCPTGFGTPSGLNGDVNGDGTVNIADALYLLSHLFLGGPEPHPITCD